MIKSFESLAFSLGNFEGTLDFLVYLVQKEQIDIHEISLHQIIEQYKNYLNNLNIPSIDGGAEFISSAATLLYTKSRQLLPKEATDSHSEEQEVDPRFDIIHQLLDYCRFKQLAKDLVEREQKQSACYSRGSDYHCDFQKPLGIDHLSLQDFALIFQQVLVKAASQKALIEEEIWRVCDKITFLRNALCKHSSVLFSDFFAEYMCKEELIVSFLAVLEMMKIGEIKIIRNKDLGVIEMVNSSK